MAQEAEPDIAKLLSEANAALHSENIDVGDNGDEDMNVDFNDDDMNDPELLAQLAEFGDSDGMDMNENGDDDGDEKMFEEMKNKALMNIKQVRQYMEILAQLKEKSIAFKQASDNIHFKLCSQSLKELTVLSQQIEEMDAIDFATDQLEIDEQIKSVYDKISALSVNKKQSHHQSKQSMEIQQELDENEQDKEATEQVLLQRYKMYRFAAKKSKDDGDRASAIKYIQSSKIIKSYVEQIRDGLVIWTSDLPPILEDELWSINISKKKTTNQITKAVPIKKPEQKQQIHETEYANEQIIAAKASEYRTLCIQYKKNKNIPKAKEYMRIFKDLEDLRSKVKRGEIKIKISDLPKIQQQQSQQQNETASVVQNVPQQRRLSAIEQKDYSKLMKHLKRQIEECQSDAAFLKTNDDKQSNELLKYAKDSQIMLQKVMECKKQNLELPKYSTFTIQIKTLCINNDIEENEMRVIIEKLSNLSTKKVIDIYAIIKLENVFSITTNVMKRTKFSCEFNLKKRVKIQRDKRLKNKIKYGKVMIELYQKKLFGDVLLGSALLKLKSLLDVSSIRESVSIKHEEDRKKIADLCMQIKLRKPVLSEGFTVTQKQLIKITHYPRARAQSVQTTVKSVKKVQNEEKKNDVQKVQKLKKVVEEKQVKKVINDLPNGLTEDMINNPFSAEYMESFEVITNEIEICTQQIVKNKALGKDCEELNARLEILNTNKSILEAQVSSGLLTLDDYTKKVEKAMANDLRLAKYLKGKGRKGEAARVFQRFKMMKKECGGA